MVNNGSIDAVKTTMKESRKKAERLVDVNTIEHTEAREIGANGKACGAGRGRAGNVKDGKPRRRGVLRQCVMPE